MQPPCSVGGCGRISVGRGLCSMHYGRLKRTGTTDSQRQWNKGKKCAADGCEKQPYARGYCRPHYNKFARPMMADGCRVEVDGIRCNRPHASGGYCWMHYLRLQRTGDVGPLDAKEKKKRKPNRYVSVCVDGEQILEHRYLMEKFLGRELLPAESVHHRNGKKDDNRLCNLELWVVSQPYGQRPADIMRHAIDVLRRYGPELGLLDMLDSMRESHPNDAVSATEQYGISLSDLIQYAKEILVKYATRSTALEVVEAIDDRDAGQTVRDEITTQQDLETKLH